MPKKTYVLIISPRFPKTHKRSGECTDFYSNIMDEVKLHTIRNNYPLWKHRVDEINAGRAVLSVRAWEGLPYRSPQLELIEYSSVGIQQLEQTPLCWWVDTEFPASTIDLAENDGLSLEDFEDWFKKPPKEPIAIIHFTDFRYKFI